MHEHTPGEEQFDAPAQAAEWETRYSERDGARWSGRPNGRLVAEVADLTPGRALDVGCGEGADAIWLARCDDFTVELHAVEPRIDPPPGTPHIADVVLRARHR